MATHSRTLVRIGTRGGDLALWQAAEIARLLRLHHRAVTIETQAIRTHGDRVLDTPLAEIGDKGLFTTELEEALTSGSIDLAVHSLKDLPTTLPDGLALGAVLEREDPRDVLVGPMGSTLESLGPGLRIGTSSLRRRAQLLASRPDLVLLDVRGNLPTRLAKLDRGMYDALVLARAGLVRLGLGARIAHVFEPEVLMPAVGQGALGIETRASDPEIAALLAPIDHRPTRLSTSAERAFLARLRGGCQVPVGALGVWRDGVLKLDGLVADLDGAIIARGTDRTEVSTEAEAVALGRRLAEQLLARGAAEILGRVRDQSRQTQPAPGREPA